MISLSRFTSLTHCAKSWKHTIEELIYHNNNLLIKNIHTYSHGIKSQAKVLFVFSIGGVLDQLLEKQIIE